MLSGPRRLRTNRGFGYLVGWRDKFRIDSEQKARELASRILDDPGNVAELRLHLGASSSDEELEEWLVVGLAGGSMALLRTKRKDPTFDSAKAVDLVDLVDDDASRLDGNDDTHQVSFELIDRAGRPLQASYTITMNDAPFRRGELAADGYLRLDQLADDAAMRASLTAVGLDTEDPGRRPLDPPVRPGLEHFISFEVSGGEGLEVAGRFRLTQDETEISAGSLADGGHADGLSSGTVTLHLELEESGDA